MRAVVLVILLALAGCLQAPGASLTPSSAGAMSSTPLLPIPAVIKGLAPAAHVDFGGGDDLAFHGTHVYVATHNNGMHIIDIKDPAAPVELATVDCSGSDIGATTIGSRVIVTISSQRDDGCPGAAAKGGIRLVDVTDPRKPVVLSQVPLHYGSHTHTPFGDTGIIYNSAYNLAGDPSKSPMDHHRSEIVNISDPEHPKVDAEFMFPQDSTSMGCHDILAEPALHRAICAGLTETMLWDVSDLHAPKVISTIRNAQISIHHSAATSRNGTLLALGDEYAGVLAPACHPVGTVPTGAIWFYDITDAANPKELGFVPPPKGDAGTVCTAHNFNWVDDDHVVGGFYSGGTLLIDAKDPAHPTVLSQQTQAPTSSWASYYYRGAVFSGDGVRGLDIYKLT